MLDHVDQYKYFINIYQFPGIIKIYCLLNDRWTAYIWHVIKSRLTGSGMGILLGLGCVILNGCISTKNMYWYNLK